MTVERIIGVDFGTSTSVVRVKRYQDGKPMGDSERLDARTVIFNGTYPTVPTLIQRVGEHSYYGYDAQVAKKNAIVYQGFKVNLESEDEAKRGEARALTQEFLSYLAHTYRSQSEGGHLGDLTDQERTIISYPVKWSDDTKAFMVEAAKNAGFPNVEGMDEAQAAIHAVTLQSEEYLKQRGYLQEGKPCTMLLIDMGAGTTDLVLCRYTPGAQPKNEILCTWPRDGCILFGGQEVEKLLRAYVKTKLPGDMADAVLKRCGPEKFKAWKETVVSPALRNGETVDGFSDLDMIAELLDLETEPYELTRAAFEASAREYLLGFPELVKQCLQTAGVHESTVELVILTGGHSQWYFVKEMLAGNRPELCGPLLPQIAADEGRVIPLSRPQETVALGLAYCPLCVHWKSGTKQHFTRTQEETATEKGSSPGQWLYPIQEYQKRPEQLIFVYEGSDSTKFSFINARGTAFHRGQAIPEWGPQKMVAGSRSGTYVAFLGLDGCVHIQGNNQSIRSAVREWHNIVSIACGRAHMVGLKKDGTVVAAGEIREGQCDVADWKDIVSLACGDEHTVGLKKDGTVVASGNHSSNRCKVSDWTQVVSIVCGARYTAGLKQDGTVVSTNFPEVSGDVKWQNVCAIRSCDENLCGMRKDGTILYKGLLAAGPLWENTYATLLRDRLHAEKIARWRDMVAVAGGNRHIVALQRNGTIVTAGENQKGQCTVEPQGKVAAVLASGDCTVAVTQDGWLYFNAWTRKVGLLTDKILSYQSGRHSVCLFPELPGPPIPDEVMGGEDGSDLDW